MTTPKAPGARGRKKKVYDPTGSDSSKARLLLAFVCVWPLILTAILSGNADRPHDLSKKNNTETAEKPALRLRKLLDRVDVVGYGPTHPRVAAVVVGDSSDSEKVITTVESIFRYGTKSKGSVCCCFMEEYTHQLCTETQIGTDCSLCV